MDSVVLVARAWTRRPPVLGSVLDATLGARLTWDVEHMDRHVTEELGRRLSLAARVGAYPDLTSAGDPHERLRRVPLLPRQRLANDGKSYLDSRWPRSLLREARTSGGSGEPLSVWRDPLSRLLEQSFLRRQLRAFGWKPGDASLALRAEGPRDPAGPRVARSPWGDEWIAAASALDARGAQEIVEAGARHQVRLLRGYPSALLELARRIEEHGLAQGLTAWPLALIHVSSETLTPEAEARLRETFGVPVAEQYGQAERALLIQSCPAGQRHLIRDYGVGEIVDGEWVGTPLFGCLALLRYRTGDLAGRLPDGRRIDDATCTCGWPFPIVGPIDGRRDAVLITPDGRRIGRIGPALRAVPGLARAQVEQTRSGLVVRFEAWNMAEVADVGETLRREIESLLGAPSLPIELRFGEPPLRDPTGRIRAVVRASEVAKVPE